jgi:hypothetical protein
MKPVCLICLFSVIMVFDSSIACSQEKKLSNVVDITDTQEGKFTETFFVEKKTTVMQGQYKKMLGIDTLILTGFYKVGKKDSLSMVISVSIRKLCVLSRHYLAIGYPVY